jgi:hypothetical protein
VSFQYTRNHQGRFLGSSAFICGSYWSPTKVFSFLGQPVKGSDPIWPPMNADKRKIKAAQLAAKNRLIEQSSRNADLRKTLR